MSQTEHSPTPWKCAVDPNVVRAQDAQNGRWYDIAHCHRFNGQEEANAAFIVRAVNAHDALVKALEAVSEACKTKDYRDALSHAAIADIAEVALRLAQSPSKAEGV